MITILSRAAILACAVAVSLSAQSSVPTESSRVQIRYASFDPLSDSPEIPAALRSTSQQDLRIVQFAGIPTEAGRQAILAVGGKIIGYLPSNSYVAHLTADQAERVRGATTVRWVGDYHPAFRIDPALIASNRFQESAIVRYNIVVADKRTDKPAISQKVRAIGGAVTDTHGGGLLVTVALTGEQLAAVAGLNEVLWIDEWTDIGYDMNNARIQGGGNYVEAQAGYTGTGVNAHIYEGVEAGHQDFTGGVTVVNSSNTASTHGHCTAGIVFGNGTSNPSVRGMAPDCGKFFTNGTSTSRYTTFGNLVNTYNVSHTTASWGGARTFFYTSTSASADDMIFDHDLAWTQSQSNAGNQDSRPEAWAKNVFSIGGVAHGNNSSAGDDSWLGGNASIGPASDGRIKPTLTAYYDQIGTSDRTGSAGYSSNNWYSNFGGTSGATPIVAGHNVIAIQMYTDEISFGVGQFGQQLRVPGGTSHQNRPHFPTLKALQVVSASQYSFTASSNNNIRVHQGWGFPNLQTMWNMRQKTFIVDETAPIMQGVVHSYGISVAPGESALKCALNWAELPANPASALHLINNLSLKVTAPNGTTYWGNNQLQNGVWSLPGGSEDSINSIECVFVQNPAAGNWNVEVFATSVVQDSHVETPAVDADYGLVVTGGQGTQAQFAQFTTYGAGCESSVVITEPPCFTWNAAAPLSGTVGTLEYAHRVANTGAIHVGSFDFYTRSTSGSVVVPAHIYTGTQPGLNPIATTTMTIGSAPGFYTATFASPVAVGGAFFIALDLSAGGVLTGETLGGSPNLAYTRPNGAAAWTISVPRNAWSVTCVTPNPPCFTWNAAGPLSGTVGTLEYAHRVANTGAIHVGSFDFYTRSTSGSVVVPAHIYTGTQPGLNPIATTTMTIGSAPGFYTATFASPVAVGGAFFIALDLSAGGVLTGETPGGSPNLAYTRPNGAATWTISVPRNVWSVTCSALPNFKVPELSNTGLPVLGTSYALDLTEAPPTTFAVLASGLSDSTWAGGALPALLPGALGCYLLVDPIVLQTYITNGSGTASGSIVVPNTAGLIGTDVFHQWVALDGAANALGLVTSNAGRARVGN